MKKGCKSQLFLVVFSCFLLLSCSNSHLDNSNLEDTPSVTDPEDNKDENIEEGEDMKVLIKVNENEFTLELTENATTSKFVSMLPLTIRMSAMEHEKYYYLDESLPTDSYRPNRIEEGDVMLWGNNCLVIFYESFNTSYSYTKIGKIINTENLASTLGNGEVIVNFEVLKND